MAHQCQFCGKSCRDKSDLEVHGRTHTGEKPYSCDYPGCGKTFARSTDVPTHKRTHTGEKPYQCPNCPEKFSQKSNLKTHQRVHTGDKPYKCPDCPKAFSHPHHLKDHERIHTGDRPFNCKICDKTFTTSSNLKVHERIHNGENPYACKMCKKTFTTSSNLNAHTRTHNGNKPYKCDKCDKTFSHQHQLTNHTRVHTGARPFSCERCNKTFIQSSHLSVHKKKCNATPPLAANIGQAKKAPPVPKKATKESNKTLTQHNAGVEEALNSASKSAKSSPGSCVVKGATRIISAEKRVANQPLLSGEKGVLPKQQQANVCEDCGVNLLSGFNLHDPECPHYDEAEQALNSQLKVGVARLPGNGQDSSTRIGSSLFSDHNSVNRNKPSSGGAVAIKEPSKRTAEKRGANPPLSLVEERAVHNPPQSVFTSSSEPPRKKPTGMSTLPNQEMRQSPRSSTFSSRGPSLESSARAEHREWSASEIVSELYNFPATERMRRISELPPEQRREVEKLFNELPPLISMGHLPREDLEELLKLIENEPDAVHRYLQRKR